MIGRRQLLNSALPGFLPMRPSKCASSNSQNSFRSLMRSITLLTRQEIQAHPHTLRALWCHPSTRQRPGARRPSAALRRVTKPFLSSFAPLRGLPLQPHDVAATAFEGRLSHLARVLHPKLIWEYQEAGWARRFFKDWFGWVSRSQLKPMADVAHLLKRHLENLLTYLRHHITNAVTEGLNSKIQSIKSAARGFRNFKNYRIRILFFCGKLNLYPL